jgi:ribosome biogenesis GTPase
MKARIIEEHKTNYVLRDGERELIATVRGSFFEGGVFPKVGDYVQYQDVSDGKAVIESIEPRTTIIARKSAHDDSTQVIVANVDLMFIVMGLDKDFNLSRLERYLLLAQQSKVTPVIILNKSDELTQEELNQRIESVQNIAAGAPVHAVSAEEREGKEHILPYFEGDKTAVLLGSSGVGKSTITNWLLDENKQEVRHVREDDSRGRHTTTSRQLFELPHGGYLIDTPGIRELSVQNSSQDDEEELFERFTELARQCKFSNCDHIKSTGCAILAALTSGIITEREYQSFMKIRKEREYHESKMSSDHDVQYRHKQRDLHKGYNKILKDKYSRRGGK